MHLNVAPLYNSYMLSLAQANREAWRTNVQLADRRLKKAGTAAAASELRTKSAEMELAALKQTASWRLISGLRALRRGQRRLTGRFRRSRAE